MADYSDPDIAQEQPRNNRGKAPSEPEGYTVLGSVDVLDRPVPNTDPWGKANFSYEQPSYFEVPNFRYDGNTSDDAKDLEHYEQNGHKY